MNKQLTEEEARLFAEFLDWPECKEDFCTVDELHFKNGEFSFDIVNVEGMKFKTSWDWIFLVIKKIIGRDDVAFMNFKCGRNVNGALYFRFYLGPTFKAPTLELAAFNACKHYLTKLKNKMDSWRQRATVHYQVATYSGDITVYCDSNDDNEHIEAKAKRQLIREVGTLPFGYQSFKVTNRSDLEDHY